jgi:hypothetical protein
MRKDPTDYAQSVHWLATSLASAAGLRCGMPPRLPGNSQGMLAADFRSRGRMPDGPRNGDVMLVPAGGMETSPA